MHKGEYLSNPGQKDNIASLMLGVINYIDELIRIDIRNMFEKQITRLIFKKVFVEV